jgi:hypothetical protein
MTKKVSQRTRTSSKSKTQRRGQHGGELAGYPASSWGWVNGTLGNGWTQFMNSLTLQPGQNAGTSQSNDIVPVNNMNAQDQQGNIGTNLKGDIPQKGGKRRSAKSRSKSMNKSKSKSKSRSKRGGSWMGVINQAIVPGVLLAAQEMYGSKKSRRQKK